MTLYLVVLVSYTCRLAVEVLHRIHVALVIWYLVPGLKFEGIS